METKLNLRSFNTDLSFIDYTTEAIPELDYSEVDIRIVNPEITYSLNHFKNAIVVDDNNNAISNSFDYNNEFGKPDDSRLTQSINTYRFLDSLHGNMIGGDVLIERNERDYTYNNADVNYFEDSGIKDLKYYRNIIREMRDYVKFNRATSYDLLVTHWLFDNYRV